LNRQWTSSGVTELREIVDRFEPVRSTVRQTGWCIFAFLVAYSYFTRMLLTHPSRYGRNQRHWEHGQVGGFSSSFIHRTCLRIHVASIIYFTLHLHPRIYLLIRENETLPVLMVVVEPERKPKTAVVKRGTHFDSAG
jgi:hypothetical protein